MVAWQIAKKKVTLTVSVTQRKYLIARGHVSGCDQVNTRCVSHITKWVSQTGFVNCQTLRSVLCPDEEMIPQNLEPCMTTFDPAKLFK